MNILNLGQKIKKHRKEMGLSLRALADVSSCSISYLWELENRRSINPTVDKVKDIAAALCLSMEYLCSNEYILHDAAEQRIFLGKFKELSRENRVKLNKIMNIL